MCKQTNGGSLRGLKRTPSNKRQWGGKSPCDFEESHFCFAWRVKIWQDVYATCESSCCSYRFALYRPFTHTSETRKHLWLMFVSVLSNSHQKVHHINSLLHSLSFNCGGCMFSLLCVDALLLSKKTNFGLSGDVALHLSVNVSMWDWRQAQSTFTLPQLRYLPQPHDPDF